MEPICDQLGPTMKSILVAALTSVSLLTLAPATVMAADLIIDEPMVGVVEAAAGDWEGVYLGAFIGGASGSFDDTVDDGYPFYEDSIDLSGWLVGVNAGANFYIADGIVGGIVGDIAWSDISGSLYDDYYEYTINWQGSLRGKLGFDGGSFMPYVTGGLAFANGTFDWNSSSESQTHLGWTIGAGVEIAATEDLSIDLLYRYSNYGEKTYFDDYDFSLDTHQVTVGLNWQF
jgi:outer membrane immunogenic protein